MTSSTLTSASRAFRRDRGPRRRSRIKRSMVVGTFMRAITCLPSSSITTSKFSDRLEMCGRGAGSMARGVRMGSMSLTNLSLSSCARRRGPCRGHHAYALFFQGGISSLFSILRRSSKNSSVWSWIERAPQGSSRLERGSGDRSDLLLQPCDPDHEELVQVGLGDGDESHPLQQRVPLVAGLFENPVVEPQPRAPCLCTAKGRKGSASVRPSYLSPFPDS